MTYHEILAKFEVYKNDPSTSNEKLMFLKNGVFASYLVGGKYEQVSIIAHCYIPTNKGYVSSEWKKNPLSKMEFELTEEAYDKISSFIQEKQPNHFIPPYTRGENVANVLAKHLRYSDPYDRN